MNPEYPIVHIANAAVRTVDNKEYAQPTWMNLVWDVDITTVETFCSPPIHPFPVILFILVTNLGLPEV